MINIINTDVNDNNAVIKTGAVDKYLKKLFISNLTKIVVNKIYLGDTVISSSEANKSPETNSFHASTGHK